MALFVPALVVVDNGSPTGSILTCDNHYKCSGQSLWLLWIHSGQLNYKQVNLYKGLSACRSQR